MSLLRFDNDYLRNQRTFAARARHAVDSDDHAVSTTASLASWAGMALQSFEGSDPQKYFREMLAQGAGQGPVEWCEHRKLSLSDDVRGELAQYPATKGAALSHKTAFILGRALMQAAIAEPAGTQGLTLPLRFVENFDNGNMAWSGAEEWLRLQAKTLGEKVLVQLDDEIKVYAVKPLSRVSVAEARYLEADIEHWKSACGMEQALGISAHSGLVDPDLRPVLMALARDVPEFVASRLDKLGVPSLASGMLRDRYDTDEDALVALLSHADPVIDDSNAWNGRFAARLVLEEVEQRCVDMLRDDANRRRNSGAPALDIAEVSAFVQKAADLFVPVLLDRKDGVRLAAEWAAHLIATRIGRAGHTAGAAMIDVQAVAAEAWLSAITRAQADSPSSTPSGVWITFGGKPEASPVAPENDVSTGVHALRGATHAVWFDRRGKRDRLSPLMVAIQYASEAGIPSAAGPLCTWAVLILTSIRGEPCLFALGRKLDPLMAAYVAWPLASAVSPRPIVQELWTLSSDTLMLAKSQSSRQDPEAVDCIAAVACTSIAVLAARANATPEMNDRVALADDLLRMMDELRYSVPTVGLTDWDALTGRLISIMANASILGDTDSIEHLIARYAGDDDALVSAIGNAAANEALVRNLAIALGAQGIDIPDLGERWSQWNNTGFRDTDPKGSEIYKRLMEVDTASRTISPNA